MNIGIGVEASKARGFGHLARCLTIGKIARKRGHDVVYFCSQSSADFFPFIEKDNFPVIELNTTVGFYDPNFIESFKEQLTKESIDFLIVDNYAVEEGWESKVKNSVKKLLVIDDLAEKHHNCDYLLDYNPWKSFPSRYDSLVTQSCKKLLGPTYILLREEFFAVKTKIKTRSSLQRIFVNFGGTDSANQVPKVLSALGNWPNPLTVILGSSHPHSHDLKDMYKNKDQWLFVEQTNEISRYMLECDLAIGAGGITSWERAFLGLPSLLISVADNQIEAAQHLEDCGAAIYLGHYPEVTASRIEKEVENMTSDKLQSLSLAGLEMFKNVSHERLIEDLNW